MGACERTITLREIYADEPVEIEHLNTACYEIEALLNKGGRSLDDPSITFDFFFYLCRDVDPEFIGRVRSSMQRVRGGMD